MAAKNAEITESKKFRALCSLRSLWLFSKL